jgi:hypothetical protein
MRDTFYTDGSHLFDPTGKKVILRGINKMSVWDEIDPTGNTYFAEIRKTGANSVRIGWAITKDLKPGGTKTSLDTLDALITNARKNQLIPIVELHDATGDWDRLPELVDYWVQPEVVDIIQKHQAYLLLNIGNEVGDEKVTQSKFISGYKDAVKRMRKAGIHNPLVIDALDWGKDLEILNVTADKLTLPDPDKNLIFSVHLFWPKSSGVDADFIQSKLQEAVDHGYPLIVGEFSKYGGFAGNDEQGNPRSVCSEFGEIDYQTILKACGENEIGWLAWEWGPGNGRDDPLCVDMDMTLDGRFDSLKPGWATDVVNSIKQASEKQDYFRLEPVPEVSVSLQTRIKTLNAVLSDPQHVKAVSAAMQESKGDFPKAMASLTEKKEVPTGTLQKLELAHTLAAFADDNVPVVKALASDPAVTSLRDVALNYNAEKLTALVDPKSLLENVAGSTEDEKTKNFVVTLQRKLYRAEPTAVLHMMVREEKIPIADKNVREGVDIFLSNQPEFDISKTSIYTALKQPEAFKDIAQEHRPGVTENLKTIQRLHGISPVQEAVPVLMKANFFSASDVADKPESTFLRAMGPALGEETARQVYTSAINTNIRNTNALMTIREAMQGSGLEIIDHHQTVKERVAALQAVVNESKVELNLETLFGGIDFCECDDCLSVYSPASYFVDILQYLRNNDLDPNAQDPTKIKKDPTDITGTPLEKLFLRRPDLGCLELTCENTFTVLPYVDLVNEVMESFVVHLKEYKDETDPKKSILDVFNVTDETKSELLAQPQHVNYQAYCTLKSAVYPFTLPYHQCIDVIRIWLKYMNTSRYELLDTFRTATETCANVVLKPEQQQELQNLHGEVLNRAVDAEFLGMTQEEYIILTCEAFWPKAYFDLLKKELSDKDYRQKIGVKPVPEYYGYYDDPEPKGETEEIKMLSTEETSKEGLTFVKGQFLPRTRIQYVDLVNLLKTRYINPAFPQGKALTIMESIRYSYRYLQKLVDTSSKDPKVRFAKLIDFLNTAQPLVPLVEAMLHPDPCHEQDKIGCLQSMDFHNWVYCYFERIGGLIVLESGEGPLLPIEGQLFKENRAGKLELIGSLLKDGTVLDKDKSIIGTVTIEGQVLDLEKHEPLGKKFDVRVLYIYKDGPEGDPIGYIDNNGFMWYGQEQLTWLPARDTCDLDKVRLKHLDGSGLTVDEYDRMQRFIRLWHKLGWTIDETDQALVGLYTNPGGEPTTPAKCDFVGLDAFQDDCVVAGNGDNGGCPDGNGDINCPDIPKVPTCFTPEFMHQLVAIRKLIDLTGLPLDKLLTFWADISTAGEKSLYARLFLTHNLLGIDKVFEPDANGNYLTKSAKISDHMPVLMAALRMKADDVAAVKLAEPDALTLKNVSVLYHYSLLAKILHVRVKDLAEVTALLGDPFKSAQDALGLLSDWGNMEDAGFTFRQLNYLIRNQDDPLHPLSPSDKTILQTTKTLFDGLNAIDNDNQDIPLDKKDKATADLIRTKVGLLLEQSVAEQIIGLLEGTAIYATNAPTTQDIKIPETDTLAKKLKYSKTSASIQVTGILTDDEKTRAKALSSDSSWAKAIDRASKKALQSFNDTMSGIIPKDKQDKLLAGDVNVPFDPNNPTAADANTAPEKRFLFLQYFMPFLRQRLSHKLIVDTMSSAASLSNEVTDVLLSSVLLTGDSQHAIDALQKIHQKPAEGGNDWTGYLIPSADDNYLFFAKSPVGNDQPPAILIDGTPILFTVQQEDPTNVWSADPEHPITLKSGKLYSLVVTGQPIAGLQWKTSTSTRADIPSSALLPDYSTGGTKEVFIKLFKDALLVNGFSLTLDEVNYWQNHAIDFDGFDFNEFDFHDVADDSDLKKVKLGHWRRMQAYASLRDKLPKTEKSLLDLFAWANNPDDASKLSEYIASATLWKKEYIESLIAPEHFDLKLDDFRNEVNLVKLQKAIKVSDAIRTDIDRLFKWANPASSFWVCHQIAEGIRAILRARYSQEDWEQVVKPLNDQLREDQKQALISYLLVQEDLVNWGVVDADSLFEFFLIDVQMDPCMQTSRIKQAISSVQLFVQRCMLGLEVKYGVPTDALDRDRWDWMQKYRVWEANRKVFIHPENWIKPELRDDKSPFYKELESELLQNDINTQTVTDVLKSYLFKVDEVANLKVVGLFVEQDIDKDGKPVIDQNSKPVYIKLHVFAQTRNKPYLYYYRYLDVTEGYWYPWYKIQVDIPSYEEEILGKITDHGTYLVPVVWNKRPIMFFPQFSEKSVPPSTGSTTVLPKKLWEIKLAWSELRNGNWTQKQISDEAVWDETEPHHQIRYYQFIPRMVTDHDEKIVKVVVDVHRPKLMHSEPDDLHLGAFQFLGSQISKNTEIQGNVEPVLEFHYDIKVDQIGTIYSLQAMDEAEPDLFKKEPNFVDNLTGVTFTNNDKNKTTLNFSHSFVHELMGKLATSSLDDLFDYYLNKIKDTDKDDAFGADLKAKYSELKRPYSLYNWEAAFHAPMLLVDRLLNAQQFDQALKMCHYVLNPYAEGQDENRFWQFWPFKKVDPKNDLEDLFLNLKPNQPDDPDGAINEWRNKPFQPHVVARKRPSAYMKWVAMKYIEILIAYGDYYFRQNTLETVPLAIQCYVLAAHIYGPRGQRIPKTGKTLPQTYNSLLDKWDAFGNAMVELELIFPSSNQTPLPMGASNGVVGLANIFGFASTLYFCIPFNPELKALRDTIDDRLFKIRHCEDIEGVFRQLPLFEPPIDPSLLVQAAAAGLSLSSVLNDLNSPMPNYRFYYLLQKALELCSEVKALGNAFLSIKEKGDAEALSQLRAKHESSIQNLIMKVKKQQLDEADKAYDALLESRKGPCYRLKRYRSLIGDLSSCPDINAEFTELSDQIEPPEEGSGLKLIKFEKEEMDKASEAAKKQIEVGSNEVLASMLSIVPNFSVGYSIYSVSFGGSNMGSAAAAVARNTQIYANIDSFQSTNAGRNASFLRQLQDRVLQANIAGHELKSIDKQILTQEIRKSIASQEITNQQKQIDNAQEVEEFLRSKYTNQELYLWMDGQIRTLYHQAYTLAYDLAKRAEKVFRFERGLTTSNFIQYGYWEDAYDGLFSGERLYIGLKQLEAAYQEERGHDFEVSKSISLRQIDPLALIHLKETGTWEFALPEVLFDMDYPGHYMRRIKSVSLRIPCTVGPYTNLNCTLRLLEHKFRINSIATNGNDYIEKTDETDDRFSTVNVPITSIAVSSLEDENGVFELNFHDERYLPFEGAGAISKWRIELPDGFRQFDYDTIADVIIRIRYTSLDGGDKLKKWASDSVTDYIKSVEQMSQEEGLFAAFDLKNEFPSEWYSANHPAQGADRVLTIDKLYEKLPIFTRGHSPAKIQATDIYLFASCPTSEKSCTLSKSSFTMTQNENEIPIADGQKIGSMMSVTAKELSGVTMESFQIQIKDKNAAIDKMWLLVRYVLDLKSAI